ncbi:MAG: cache domain-containing protein [Gemmatimonadetes bacterium]|nr:cache domain-containing protein [Gemmatimonadota bacterium]
MRAAIILSILFLTVFATQSCRSGTSEPPESTQGDLRTAAVATLDALVADLVAERPADSAAYAERLRVYLEANPAFYGSAVALLDEADTVTDCPYVYRTSEGYDTIYLATPAYNIEGQDWFMMPLEANAGIWTSPYFDAGGGEIWMITRSVPARDDKGVFAIVTTDLPVDPPEKE